MDHLNQSKNNSAQLILSKYFPASTNRQVIIGHNPLKQFRITVQINSKNDFGVVHTVEFNFEEFTNLWKCLLNPAELKPGSTFKIVGTRFSLWTTFQNNERFYIIFNTNNCVEESICIDQNSLNSIFSLEEAIFEELNIGKAAEAQMLKLYRKSISTLVQMFANEEVNMQLMKKIRKIYTDIFSPYNVDFDQENKIIFRCSQFALELCLYYNEMIFIDYLNIKLKF